MDEGGTKMKGSDPKKVKMSRLQRIRLKWRARPSATTEKVEMSRAQATGLKVGKGVGAVAGLSALGGMSYAAYKYIPKLWNGKNHSKKDSGNEDEEMLYRRDEVVKSSRPGTATDAAMNNNNDMKLDLGAQEHPPVSVAVVRRYIFASFQIDIISPHSHTS
jgi:hypothetical protein